MGRDGFEDIGRKLGEVEDGLRPHTHPTPTSANLELDEPRKIGMMLILSLRMSLSYFSLRELADQLLVLGIADAERALVQHIRRRVAGEGRFGVGKELEHVQGLVSLMKEVADRRR